MNRDERLSWLLEELSRTGRIRVAPLARAGDVSSATIRRDLEHLESQQLLTRTHGGAVANGVSYDLPLRYKAARHTTEKQRIGMAAAELVAGASVIGLNGGTTTTEVARAIANRLVASQPAPSPVTIVTNALNIATELTVRPHIKIVVTGGSARAQSYELVGPLASSVMNQIGLDIAFIGVDGIDPDHGASASNEEEANVNRLMASQAQRVVVVADNTKLMHRAFANICELDRIDTLVTDSGATAESIERFEAKGLRVIRV